MVMSWLQTSEETAEYLWGVQCLSSSEAHLPLLKAWGQGLLSVIPTEVTLNLHYCNWLLNLAPKMYERMKEALPHGQVP